MGGMNFNAEAASAKQKAMDKKQRKKAAARAEMEAEAAGKPPKKGFMTPSRKNKLRNLLRKKAAEELKRKQEMQAEERKKTIAERCGPQKKLDGIKEAELINICKEFQDRMVQLEGEKYDMEFQARHKEYKINALTMEVNDLHGKFIKPVLKKVSKFEHAKFEKLLKAAKKADNDFSKNLKSVGPSTKYKLEDDIKEPIKPEWAVGVKEVGKKAEE